MVSDDRARGPVGDERPSEIEDHRLYRTLNRLLPHKEAIGRQRLGELFALEYDLLLYDVTSTYFEGLAARNALAAQGYSRDHRPDCKPDQMGFVTRLPAYR